MISNSCLSKINRIYKQYEELSKCMFCMKLKDLLSKKYDELSKREQDLVRRLSEEIPKEYFIEIGMERFDSLHKKYVSSVLNADP